MRHAYSVFACCMLGHLGSMQLTRERQGYEIVFYCVQQPPEGHQHEARFASQSHWEIAVHDDMESYEAFVSRNVGGK